MKQKLLLVDDVDIYLDILNELLGREYDLLMANSGDEALEICRREMPDLVLLDVLMPGMNGHDVCRALKNDKQLAGIPVIFVTTESDPADETLGLEIGAVDYITKPFSPDVVMARVRNHLLIEKQRKQLKESVSLLEHEKELLEQKAELGLQAGGLAHDMANVLSGLQFLQYISEDMPGDAEWQLLLEDIKSAASSLDLGIDICHGFTSYLRGMGEGSELHEVSGLLQSLRIYRRRFRGELDQDIEEGLPPIKCKAWQIKRVLVNLFSNAMQAVEEQKYQKIFLRAWQEDGSVFFSIRDNGPGIAPDVLPRVCEECFTTKKGGTGLGLYMARAIMDAQKGSLDVKSEAGQGAEVILAFPVEAG